MRSLAAFLVLIMGCGSIEAEPAVDANGTPIPQPAAGENWLAIKAIAPQADVIPARPEVVLTFSDYVSAQRLVGFDVISLTSGGKRASGRSVWSDTDKTLRWRPYGPLIDGLDYTLQINDSRLESVVGSPLFPPGRRTWRVDGSLPDSLEQGELAVGYEAVEDILRRQCWSCHQDPQWQLNRLERDSMIGHRGQGVETFLVVPFSPGESYLMQKVLPAHPLILWDTQPPAWSGAEPLSATQILTIERWIRQGAR